MELYFKDLISEEASLEKLVDDLLLVVQGADEFAQAAGANLAPDRKAEITSRLQRLRESCRRAGGHAMDGARAADQLLRQHPYSFAGIAFAVGLLVGVAASRRGGVSGGQRHLTRKAQLTQPENMIC